MDHSIRIEIENPQQLDFGGVVEATGLFLNSFIEGDSVQHPSYIYRVERENARSYLINGHLRHPIVNDRFELERAFSSLYLIFAGWTLAGASVEALGPWRESLPSGGTWKPAKSKMLRPRMLFQDEVPTAKQVNFPTFKTLSEIYENLPHQASWDEPLSNRQWQACFPQVSPHPESLNNIRLQHRHGCQVDLVLNNGQLSSHILGYNQPDFDRAFNRLTCERQCSLARTWWDAWVGFCPMTSLKPELLLRMPDEVAILSVSGAIWRFQIQDKLTLERPLDIDFGKGFHPDRSAEYWLELAARYGKANYVDIAIACCEQALATANALIAQTPGLTIKPTLGKTNRELLNEVETEYLRWCDRKESLTNPPKPHDRWDDKIVAKGIHELTKLVGTHWELAISELVEALNNEHYESEDYHRKIGTIPPFTWHVNGDSGTLRYYRLSGRELMEVKLPKAALAALGYRLSENVIPNHLDFEDIFTLTLGTWKFWGSVERRVLISCSDPRRAYFI